MLENMLHSCVRVKQWKLPNFVTKVQLQIKGDLGRKVKGNRYDFSLWILPFLLWFVYTKYVLVDCSVVATFQKRSNHWCAELCFMVNPNYQALAKLPDMEQTSRRDISILESSSWSWKLSWALLDFFLASFLLGVRASSTGSGGRMLGFDIVPGKKT